MKLKILQISQDYRLRGGSDRVFFDTISILRKHGHEVIPFTAASEGATATKWSAYFPKGANFERPRPMDPIRYLYSRRAALAIDRLIRDQNPKLGHLHIYYGRLTASILPRMKKAGIPIVQTLHEYKLICPVYGLRSNGQNCEACQGHAFWRALPRRCNRNSFLRTCLSVAESYISRFLGSLDSIDHFIAVSDFVRKKMISYGVPEHKISTIHNFVDMPSEPPSQAVGEYFLYVGRLERYKGVFTLLDAIEPLTECQLLIVGDGNDRQALTREIERRKLDHVTLLGFRQDRELAELIRGCRCVVLPSICYETFGLAVLEAFQFGRPVIASRIGGIPEVLDDGSDGFLVAPEDAAALRNRITWMKNHPTKALEMGRTGYEKAASQFTSEAYYEEIMKIYRSVL